MYQDQVCLGFNPSRVVIGSDDALPITASAETKLLVSSLSPEDERIGQIRDELQRYAEPLCKEIQDTDLPPFRAINHTIPLIDENKTYPWRPSRCPEVFRAQWAEKRDAYLKTGRWEITSTGNTVPMLLIPKPNTKPPLLRTVIDLRERNKNTKRMTSPLPDIDGMLRRTASHQYKTTLDLKNAYEQIRIIPKHVPRTSVTTPDGNMISLVVQMGDCNAPATYQALMNHIFSAYIGRFMDVYLDDIVIYSNSLEEHVHHVKLVMDVLRREKLYLSKSKLHFVQPTLKLLGRIVDSQGIQMDSAKVDSVINWKVPTNRDLLRGFIGSVGYLADDIPNVRIPMGILSAITGDTVPFRWGYTEQRAFDEVKSLVQLAREHHRVPLDYSEGAPPIWMVTDGCSSGISGLISQGDDWKSAKIAAFYSAKLNPAQQNYPVHEIEMLAGIETMMRYMDILQGVRFRWLTDHKGLTHLLNQKNLSGRQARWIEKISVFDFEVVYITGSENVVADALSRLYANDSPGTIRSSTEYTSHDVLDDDTLVVQQNSLDMPILAGIEARIATRRSSRVRRPTEKAANADVDSPLTPKPSSPSSSAKSKHKSVLLDTPTSVERMEGGSAVIDTPIAEQNSQTSDAQDEAAASLLTHENLGIDLLSGVRDKYKEDPFFRVILEKPKEYRNFEYKEGLIYLKDNDTRTLCVPKALIEGRSIREILISEAHSLLAHLGAGKTLDYLRDVVWWKDMVSDVKAFCETCHTCKTSKPSNQKPYGLLNPLAVASYPWESIGIDFVGPLPESSNRDSTYDSITVIICLLTSMVHLVPSRINYNASQLAELMFEQVYKIHGLPKNIISDRDVLFTSIFWSRLHNLIGTKLRMSSAYHPQSDGATERANRTVTQMLRQCIHPNQKDWVTKLPAIEFAINSARSASTGYAPFFLNFGRMPKAMLWAAAPSSEYPSVREFALQKRMSIIAAHDSILAARVKQTRDANRKRQATPFKVGDLVYLSAKNISFPKGLARKLTPKFIGPYKILKDFGNASFQLDLPHHLKKRGVHDVFHLSLLRIHIPSDDRLFPGRMDTQVLSDEPVDDEWAVDHIRSHAGDKSSAVFEILWKSGDITWLPYYQITHLQALTDYLELLGVSQISQLPKGSGQPPTDDPQIFIGSITPSVHANHSRSSPSLLPSLTSIHPLFLYLKSTFAHLLSLLPFARQPFISLTVDLEFITLMPKLQGIDHPLFTRTSDTHYRLKDIDGYLSRTVHVGQIADYMKFDEQVRRRGNVSRPQTLPLGYIEFAEIWNSGARHNDQRRVSSVFRDRDSDEPYVEAATSTPVYTADFHITPEQVGLSSTTHSLSSEVQNGIMQEFASIMMEQRQNSRRGFEQRQNKRHRQLNRGPANQPAALLSRLEFKEKRGRRQCSPARTPSPAPSDYPDEDPQEPGEPEEQEAILPAPEETGEMETNP
jgi:hypothetical protein